MSSPRLVYSSVQPAVRQTQKPIANPFDGRGRSRASRARAGWSDPGVLRADMPERWALFVRRVFSSRDDCAGYFGVTFQTACNWFDGGVCRPSGHIVTLAALAFPEEFRAVMVPATKRGSRDV